MGACWQSVLSVQSWGDVGGSPFLTQLKAAARDGLLSINFNVYGFNAGYGVGADGVRHLPNPPGFTTGLLTGSIGVADKDEPRHFPLARRLQPAAANPKAPPPFYYASAMVDERRKALTFDLGNSVPYATWGGKLVGTPFQIGYLDGPEAFRTLGEIKPDDAWYERTAGICEIPLSDAQVAAIAVAFDPTGLQTGAGDTPPVGTPTRALHFSDTVTTDARGMATLTLSATDPGEPRKADNIDGQVYGVRPMIAR